MDNYRQFIRNRITELQSSEGVSSKTMSYELGYSHAYISNILSGKKMPSLKRIVEIAEYFDISLSEFFNENIVDPKYSNKLNEDISALSVENKQLLQSIIKLMK